MIYQDAIAEIKRQLPHLKEEARPKASPVPHRLVQALEAIIATDEAMRKNAERIEQVDKQIDDLKKHMGYTQLDAAGLLEACKVTTSTIKQQEKE